MTKQLALALIFAGIAVPAAATVDITKIPSQTFAVFSQAVPARGAEPKLAYYKSEDVTKTTVVVTRVPHTTTTTVIVNVPTVVVTKVPVLNSLGKQIVTKSVPQFKNVTSIVQVPTPKQVTTTTYTNVSTYSTHTTPKAELYTTPGSGSTLASPIVKFNYTVPVAPWAQSALSGTQSAYFTLDAVSNSAAIVTGTNITEAFQSGTISFIRTTLVQARDYKGHPVGAPKSDLLTISFTNATLEGSVGSSTFALDVSTPSSTIAYSSDFLNFTNSYNNGISLVFHAAVPQLSLATTTLSAVNQTNVTGAHTLNSTRATVAGQFGASAVPEPAVWGMMVAGFALVGLRRRNKTSVVVA